MIGEIGWSTRLGCVLTLCIVLVALAGCGGKAATSAQSKPPKTPTYEPSRTVGEFGKHDAGAGGLEEAFGIAVDQRNGDVYVVDSNHYRVEKFTGTGTFLRAWGWGVADGRTHKLQTCTRRCFAGIGGEGTGQFNFPEGVAVDNDPASASYRDVYVVDLRNRLIDKFDARGKFLFAFGGGVNRTAHERHDHAAEDICPVRPHDVCGRGSDGTNGAQLEFGVECSCIAVAPGGTVYVGQRNRVKLFSPTGTYLSQIKLTPEPLSTEGQEAGGVSGLAINAAGDFYVIRHSVVGVHEYAPSGTLLRTLEPGGIPEYAEGPTPALALDQAGDVFIDIYANEQHRIDEFNSTGTRITSFDRGPKAPPGIADKEDGLPGMAFGARTKKLYLINADVNVRPVVERVRILAPPGL